MSRRQKHSTLVTLCEEPVSHYRQDTFSCVLTFQQARFGLARHRVLLRTRRYR